MSAHLAAPSERRTPALGTVLGLALLFWAFTFGLIMLRAELSVEGPHGVIGFRRFFGTLAGAVAYGLVLHWIFGADQRRGFSQAFAIVGTVLPASLLVLAVRAIANAAFYEVPQPWEENVRWVLVWAGYFGLWVSATLVFRHNFARRADVRACAAPRAEAPAKAPQAAPADTVSEAWLAFIDAAAEELAALPEADRAAIAARLAARVGYELADDWTGGVHNARADLARRLLARLDRP